MELGQKIIIWKKFNLFDGIFSIQLVVANPNEYNFFLGIFIELRLWIYLSLPISNLFRNIRRFYCVRAKTSKT